MLTDVDISVSSGTAFALLGPNGAGKSTLVRILSTLSRPDAGVAVVNGHDLRDDADGVKDSISVTGQHAAVDDMLTGRENLEMIGRLRRLTPGSRRGPRDRTDRGLRSRRGRRTGW